MKKFWKMMQSCILISLTAMVLSGCAGQEQGMEEPETVTESAQAEEPDEAEVDRTVGEIKETEGIEETEEAEEPFAESDNSNVPKNTASETSSYVKVEIHNEEEYRGFVSSLEEYLDRHFLILDMQETDTVIYLDEILAYHNFRSLSISCGGIISAQNIDNLQENPLEEIDLYHTYAIEENILSQMPALQNIEIWLNSGYIGVMPAKELIHNTDCNNIAMIWDDDKKYEVHLEELAEWDEINTALLENNSYLKGVYVWNEDDYNYISYEFCEEETENACDVFICIKDRESYGEKHFDILEVPVENVDMFWSGGSRMMLDDINFDGYRDLIFMGWNRHPFDLPSHCIGFLWNEKEQRYEWNATVPKNFRKIDDERKRITNSNPSSLLDKYFIYEYHDGVFTEKKLEVIWSLTEHGLIIWQYYEEGELLKRLEENYDEETKLYNITYEENGMVTEEVLEEADYDNKYGSYSDLGMEYFPEFDFYWAG